MKGQDSQEGDIRYHIPKQGSNPDLSKLEKRVEMIERMLNRGQNLIKLDQNMLQLNAKVDRSEQAREKLENILQELKYQNQEQKRRAQMEMKERIEKIKGEILYEIQSSERKEIKGGWKVEEEKIYRIEEQMQLMKNKLNELLKHGQKKSELEEGQKELTRRIEDRVDLTTACASNFAVQRNMITLKRGSQAPQMITLNAEVSQGGILRFHTHIEHTSKEWLWIGLVDTTDKAGSCPSDCNAVAYEGSRGEIVYGQGEGSQVLKTYERLSTGMDVLMEVKMKICTVTFTLKSRNKIVTYSVTSNILSRPHRSFVPYYVMYDQGDAVTWSIE